MIQLNKQPKFIFILLCIVFTNFSCTKTQFDERELTEGDADFTNYVASGNSLTQGYQDNGLYNNQQRQENSYPALIAKQMRKVNPEMKNFEQPLTSGNGSGYMHLEYINGEHEVIKSGDDNYYEEDPSWENWGQETQGYKYNNLGISGIRLIDCVALNEDEEAINNAILGGIEIPFPDTTIPGNPYARFLDFGDNPYDILSSGEPISYIDHVRSSKATFFTSWMGNNDVLGYATSGGVVQSFEISLLGITIDFNGITEPSVFEQKYDSLLKAHTAGGAKGIVATIPDITTIPYFNKVTLDLFEEEIWIEEDGNIRKANENDLLLLTALEEIEDNDKGTEDDPLEDNYVLAPDEQQEVSSATMNYNSSIYSLAEKYDIAVVDMYKFLGTMKDGIYIDGMELSAKYIEGGTFSLDGIHPNTRGYAVVANEFIIAINEHYGSNIPLIDVGMYKGVVFP